MITILILILLIIPLISKALFWLYVIQLKEYRIDRLKEYLSTKQGRSALFNKLNISEVFFVLLLTLIHIFNISLFNYSLIEILLIFFLLVENIFYIKKIIKKDIIKPDFTGRMKLFSSSTILFFILIYSGTILSQVEGYNIILFTILIFIFPITLLINLILSPFINAQKLIIYKKAMKKSRTFNNMDKIGITGSYGKSSMKEILSGLLESDASILKTPKHVNTEMGVSRFILSKLSDKYNFFIAEMGAYKKGEIDLLGKIVDHNFGFLTGIGNQHIGLFGSQKNLIDAKLEITNNIEKNKGTLYINWDSNFVKSITFSDKIKVVKYGFNKDSDMLIKKSELKNGFTEFLISYKGSEYNLKTNLNGDHNIINLSGAIAFCIDKGISINKISKSIEKIKLPSGTCEVIEHGDIRLINDTYNLSVDGFKAGVEMLNSFKGKNIIVIDDILELGVDAETTHFDLGVYLGKEESIYKILLCGENYKESLRDGLLEGGFVDNDIISSFDNIDLSNTNILFAGRKAKKYFNETIKNVK